MRFLRLAIVGLSLFIASPAGAANPVMNLPASVRATFTCIIWHESRSTWAHLNLRDNNSQGSSGIFQIVQNTWQRWAAPLGITVKVWQATALQQELVAVNIWKHDGFSPWRGDGCV